MKSPSPAREAAAGEGRAAARQRAAKRARGSAAAGCEESSLDASARQRGRGPRRELAQSERAGSISVRSASERAVEARSKLAAGGDEVRQRVRQRLLLPAEDGVAPLVSYAGEGKLEGLVIVTATRIALDLLRERRRDQAAPTVAEALSDRGDDPLLALMKERAREGFCSAFAKAVDGLDPRDRNLLKLHLLRGVAHEKLAEMYGVHRATVVR